MKVSFFIYHLNNGGAERVMTTLANSFSKYGHEVKIYTISHTDSFYQLVDNVEHVKISRSRGLFKKISFLGNLKELVKSLRKNKPDVLISFLDINNLLAILAGKLLGVPVIISERSNPEMYLYSKIKMYLFRLLYKRADRMVLQTHASRSSFKRMKIELPSSVVIENPLNQMFFDPINLHKKNIILSVGRLSEEKGHDIFLNALVGFDLCNWEVVIVGDGIKRSAYETFVQDNNLVGKVHFVGKKENVIDYYNNSKIFVLPSRFEGFPNALTEAMSRGCVPVSSDCQYGPSEIIEPNINGFMFDVEDVEMLRNKLSKLCESRNFSWYQNNAIESAKKYEVEIICKKWMNLISEVV